MSKIKIAKTKHKVHKLIKTRWSARSFSEKVISQEDLMTLVEAASWSFSANNEQPWRFITALKGSETFDKILSCIMPGNTPWAKNAAAYIVSLAKTTFDKEGNPPNGGAEHDLGAANMSLVLQAHSMGIYCHPMGGFERAKLKEVFQLPENLKPVVVIALGYLDEAGKLEEPYRTRELTPRSRKSLQELVWNTEGLI